MTAWRMQKSDARVKAVLETKRKLQAVGIAATHLARREKKIDVTQYVAELRRAATADPFEDPDREAEDNHTGPIFATLAQLLHEIECGYGGRYPR